MRKITKQKPMPAAEFQRFQAKFHREHEEALQRARNIRKAIEMLTWRDDPKELIAQWEEAMARCEAISRAYSDKFDIRYTTKGDFCSLGSVGSVCFSSAMHMAFA